MGIKKEEKKPRLPPVFSGNAIRVRFPNMKLPDGKITEVSVITFPDWVHEIYINDKVYKVLGIDLELGMPFIIDGNYIPIIDLDKACLYHGIMVQPIPLGKPCDPSEIERFKFTRKIFEDGHQEWDVSSIEAKPAK